MEYTVTIKVPDDLVSQTHISDLNAFANKVVKQALKRKAQVLLDEKDTDEKVFNEATRTPQIKDKVYQLEGILRNTLI